VRKADLQPASDGAPNQIAVDETVIRINDERHWLYAAGDPKTNKFLHVRLFQTRTTQLTVLFLRELREKQQVEQATFLVDGAHYLNAALERLGLRFQITRDGNRNAVERVFREVKRRTSLFQIHSATWSQRRQNRGSKPSLSGGTDAKLNTTLGPSPVSPLPLIYSFTPEPHRVVDRYQDLRHKW
jgi:transposase-like protein